MSYGPGRIWWRGEHARLEKWWRCSPACISKLYLDRHHQSKLKLKFNLCLSNFCHQNFQNIVTWGVELQSRNTIFVCISMESLISGVLPWAHGLEWKAFFFLRWGLFLVHISFRLVVIVVFVCFFCFVLFCFYIYFCFVLFCFVFNIYVTIKQKSYASKTAAYFTSRVSDFTRFLP